MRRLLCLMVLVSTLIVLPVPSAGAAFPNDPGFTDTLVGNVASPTSISFASGGRMLVTTQAGAVRVFVNGALQATPALTLSGVCSSGEQGLLGSAVSAANEVFLYYTSNHNGDCWNRVSRFTLGANNLLTGEVILLDWIPTPATNHNAGDLNLGPDGKLYVSVGDGGCRLTNATLCAGNNDNARSRLHLLGKILRLNTDGTVPADNPYAPTSTRRCGHPSGDTNPGSALLCSETWSWGLRNPFRFAFRADGAMHINDVGQSAREEVDLGLAGADYGWNCREGRIANPSLPGCTLPSATEPIHDYDRSAGCISITGAAFVPPGRWPPRYNNAYLFADFGCGRIWLLDGTGVRDFATGLGSAVHLEYGPDGALYYTNYTGGGQVRRIAYVSDPVAGDFDGNRTTDVAVWRPGSGQWFVRDQFTVSWGQPGDLPVAADYDGNGTVDPAVYRRSNSLWFIRNQATHFWGVPDDIPVPADYDGNGTADLAVWRPSTGQWFVQGQPVVFWGQPGDIPVPADYDGNGTADIAVWRPSSGQWFRLGQPAVSWGLTGDIPVPADYDGNGPADLAVWRPSVGGWFIQGQPVVNWGLPGDLPVPGNFDSTPSDEIAVYRQSSGQWFVRNLFTVSFGLDGDVPANQPAAITANFMD
ncbi:MAG TPA: PQQ-dependent sugar dehydrogenase [Actinomycetota bacterium]|nr:PQQ-dependent sugar dehydrogenase [Actinomycetota bacterium]